MCRSVKVRGCNLIYVIQAAESLASYMLEFDRLGFVIDGLGMMDMKSRQMGRVGRYLNPKIEFTMDF